MPEVTVNDIAQVVSRATGVPVTQLTEEEKDRLLRLEQHLHERVIGQDEAVSAVAEAVRRSRAGLGDPDRPVGSFLFLGPTGVGKTELARALTEALFGADSRMIRLDMSEFQERHTVSRLVGAPPGYVGYEEAGQLTEAVRRQPYSVVLLDEIEKAHPDVFNILLQILDDGRLTDGQGRTVDFKNTVLIMTSNLGSDLVSRRAGTLGFSGTAASSTTGQQDGLQDQLMRRLRESFRPEFLNRIDEIIVFRQLDQTELRQITEPAAGGDQTPAARPEHHRGVHPGRGGLGRGARVPAGVRRPADAPGHPAGHRQQAVPAAARRADHAGPACHRGRPGRAAGLRRLRPAGRGRGQLSIRSTERKAARW